MTLKTELIEKFGEPKPLSERKGVEKPLFKLTNISDPSPAAYYMGEMVGENDASCDYFLLCDKGSVTGLYVVEQKEGNGQTDAIPQLKAGADFIAPRLGKHIGRKDTYRFMPVLVAKLTSNLRKKLKTVKIRVGHYNEPIKRINPGNPLPPIFPEGQDAKKK